MSDSLKGNKLNRRIDVVRIQSQSLSKNINISNEVDRQIEAVSTNLYYSVIE